MSTNFFTLEFDCKESQVLANHNLLPGSKVQQYIDTQVLRLSEPLIPKDQGFLIRSGIQYTTIGSGEVKYRTAYARRWYYAPQYITFQEAACGRGNYWFERMKQQYKDQILAGAERLLNT